MQPTNSESEPETPSDVSPADNPRTNTSFFEISMELMIAMDLMESILATEVSYKALVRLRGAKAQKVVNILQRLLGAPNVPGGLRRRILYALIRLSRVSGACPECMTLPKVQPVGDAPVAAGAFGDVWKGNLQGRIVSIKCMKLYQPSHIDHLFKTFSQEAILWSYLQHPNVLPFYGLHRVEDRLGNMACLISPWMENGNIHEYLIANPNAPRFRLVVESLNGLQYLHSHQIIHGDLKSANILITEDGSPCLTDFGLSSVLDDQILRWTSITTVTPSGGTIRWEAPELVEGLSDDLNPRPTLACDIYSFASVMYEIFTDRIPYHETTRHTALLNRIIQGKNPTKPSDTELTKLELTQETWEIMERCWDRDPSKRPNADGLVQSLHDIRPNNLTETRIALHKASLHKSRGTNARNTSRLSDLNYTFRAQDACFSVPDINLLLEIKQDDRRLRIDSNPHGDQGFPHYLNIQELPPELKKEGDDWSVVSNPVSRRQLDLTLVHTLAEQDAVDCVRFSPDGKYLATGSITTHIYDIESGQVIRELEEDAYRHGVTSLCFSRDGQFLATGACDKKIHVWDITEKPLYKILQHSTDIVWSLEFSADGRFLVSGDETIRVSDRFSGNSRILDKDSSFAGVWSVAISPNGHYIASEKSNTVYIWHAQTGRLLGKLPGHKDSVRSISFTPDSKGLVSASYDKTLKLWDISALASESLRGVTRQGLDEKTDYADSPCLMNFIGHKGRLTSVAVSRDGQWVVSGSEDKAVHFWDSKTGILQCVLRGHSDPGKILPLM